MEALILSCGTGGGHNSAGEALEEALLRRGHSVCMRNPYDLCGKNLSHRINQVYIQIAQRVPALFGVVYVLGNLYRCLPFRSPVYYANRRMVGRMEAYLAEHSYDVVLMPHLFPAEILTNLRRQGKPVPKMIFVGTDYTCIPFTEETECDAYVIPAEDLKAEYVGWGIPEDKLFPLGIPVRRAFTEAAERRENTGGSAEAVSGGASAAAPERSRYLLISGGSIGAGKLEQVIRTLLNSRLCCGKGGVRLVVVCGNNRKLYQRLRRKYGGRIKLLMHTDRMAEYMSAAGVFIGKPGGLSSTEAAAVGVPLIHVSPIPGCEISNERYFARHGMCVPVRNIRRDLCKTAEALLAGRCVDKMRRRQRRRVDPRSAEKICRLAEELTGGRNLTKS